MEDGDATDYDEEVSQYVIAARGKMRKPKHWLASISEALKDAEERMTAVEELGLKPEQLANGRERTAAEALEHPTSLLGLGR